MSRSKLSVLLQQRDEHWAKEYPRLSNIIFDKLALRDYATSKGWPISKLHHVVRILADLPYDTLPYRFVLKPNNNWSCNGVLLIRDGKELVTGDSVDYLKGYVERRDAQEYVHGGEPIHPTAYIVEELLEDFNPLVIIPRDFKVYVVKGKPKLIHVIDRNVKLHGASAASAYTPNWTRKFIGNGEFYEGIDLIPEPLEPMMLRQLLELAAEVGADIGAMVRVDCYMTPNGPVLGEITASPGGGNNLNSTFSRSVIRWLDSDNLRPSWRG